MEDFNEMASKHAIKENFNISQYLLKDRHRDT